MFQKNNFTFECFFFVGAISLNLHNCSNNLNRYIYFLDFKRMAMIYKRFLASAIFCGKTFSVQYALDFYFLLQFK